MSPHPGLLSCWKVNKLEPPVAATANAPNNIPSASLSAPSPTTVSSQQNLPSDTSKISTSDTKPTQPYSPNISTTSNTSGVLSSSQVEVSGTNSVSTSLVLPSPTVTTISPPPTSSSSFDLPQPSPVYRTPLNLSTMPHYHQRRTTRVNFEVPGPAEEIFRKERLPSQVIDLLVYLAREAITVRDLFRRSGSTQDMKRILRQLRDGTRVHWTQYSFHTLANVAKKFLLGIQGGILGLEAESQMFTAMELETAELRMESMHSIIVRLSLPVQCLLVLLFGIWFRMMYHSEANNMSLEAVAKSVAGSVFLNSCAHLDNVDKATQTMQFLICTFPRSGLFGPHLLHYFTQRTKTNIRGVERYQYSLICPPDVPRQQCVREFVRILKQESDRHHFDLLQHVVTKEQFDAAVEDVLVVAAGGDSTDTQMQGHTQAAVVPPTHQFYIQNVASPSGDLLSPQYLSVDHLELSTNGEENALTSISDRSEEGSHTNTNVEMTSSADLLSGSTGVTTGRDVVRHSCPPPRDHTGEPAVIGEVSEAAICGMKKCAGNAMWASCYSLDYKSIQQRHNERLKTRTSWFLTGHTAHAPVTTEQHVDESISSFEHDSNQLETLSAPSLSISTEHFHTEHFTDIRQENTSQHLHTFLGTTSHSVPTHEALDEEKVETVYFVVPRSYGPH